MTDPEHQKNNPYDYSEFERHCQGIKNLCNKRAKQWEGDLVKQARLAESALGAFGGKFDKCYECVFRIMQADADARPKKKKWARKKGGQNVKVGS